MSVRIVAAGEARRMPWKNGRGTTLELATDAPEADANAWTWRLSIADVPERGPFSRFPGVDRWIACLEGKGLRLHRGGQVDEVPRHGESLAFSGEDEVDGEPTGPGVRDVNLMVRRSLHRGSLRIERGGSGSARGGVVLLHAATGRVEVNLAGSTREIDRGATLVAPGPIAWRGQTGDAVVVAELDPPEDR